VDSTRVSSCSTSPVINGISDHDAHYLMTNNIHAADYLTSLKQRTRKIINETIMQFQLLNIEMWESVYKDNGTNHKVNLFLFTFVNIFEARFPINYTNIDKLKE
jgi:hypothetical protein